MSASTSSMATTTVAAASPVEAVVTSTPPMAGFAAQAPPSATVTFVADPLAAQIEELRARVTAAETAKDAAAAKAAEDAAAAERAKMDPLERELADLRTRVESQRRAALDQSLAAAGVEAGDRSLCPDVDPHTAEGRKALQAFLEAHPRLVSRAPAAPRYVEAPTSKIAALRRSASPFVNWSDLDETMGSH